MVSHSYEWAVADFDPRWSDFVKDPYPYYSRLRSEDPVHYLPSSQLWWVTRYADVMRVVRGREFRNAPPPGVHHEQPVARLSREAGIPPHMLLSDPPDHTRLRALVYKSFTPKAVASWGPRIAGIVDELLDRVEHRGQMDLAEDLAFPLPAILISEIMGIPPEDRAHFREWSDKIVFASDTSQSEQVKVEGGKAFVELVDYFRELIREDRYLKKNSIFGVLVAAEQKGKLSRGELLSMCVLLLNAGHETTTSFLTGGLLTLLNNPEQLSLLRSNPGLMRQAVEELLRFTSPAQRVPRYANEDLELGGKRIRMGDVVEAIIGSANRDPEVFSRPDELDITRKKNPHVVFGFGIHVCLGAPLITVEAPIVIGALLNRFPDLRLQGEPVWNGNTRLRGLKSLPLAF